MTKNSILRITSGILVILIGVVLAFASFQLKNGAPSSWSDIVVGDSTVKSVSKGMAVVPGLLVIAGMATTMHFGWGYWAATVANVAFVAGGFWANYILFGSLRPIHTATNVVVCAVIQWLLWTGYSASWNP